MHVLCDLIRISLFTSSIASRIADIAMRSLFVCGSATLIATLLGLPIAVLLALKSFRGKFLLKTVFNSLMGIPTVALGFFLFLAFLRETGPFGFLGLLYTPTAIIIGEAILVTPIVVSLATTAIEAVDPEIMSLARTLGASESEASIAVLKEALNGIVLAVITSFNRAIGELGIAQFLGGAIFGVTELLTTGIWVEIQSHNIDVSIALAAILIAVVFTINLIANIIFRRSK